MATNANEQWKTSNEVLAATAGVDSWRTFAGRTTGGEGFQLMDLARAFVKTVTQQQPPAGTECPVCYEVPEEWNIVSSCGHATCIDCFHAYAASQVADPAHHGFLRCPACPCPLRTKDAVKAIGNNPEALALWDARLRDQALKRMSGFRLCPNCGNRNSNETTNDDGSNNNNNNNNAANDNNQSNGVAGEGQGRGVMSTTAEYKPLTCGGFATAECLAGRSKQLHSFLSRCLAVAVLSLAVLVEFFRRQYLHDVFVKTTFLACSFVFHLMLCDTANRFLNERKILDDAAEEGHLERMAGKRVVSCPGCDVNFSLASEGSDASSEEWIKKHTRNCPGCNVVLTKARGCSHMRCTQCGVHFCWKCMKQTFLFFHSCPETNTN
ncbi:RING finger protein [Seminavis robusta]|uniref:RING finger protein n=1 Tax=Seminavis robusta TaxID=568900 RepID=A0A9N8ENU9_9STRA|nr:RING finger protein [Seminavis robusta]|eukprot:Sro1305_g261220.1 RING finger) protein (380) ;mRNA; r:29166-30376